MTVLLSRFALAAMSLCCLAASSPGEEPQPDPGDRWVAKAENENLEPFEMLAYYQLSQIHMCQFRPPDSKSGIQVVSYANPPKEPTDILHAIGLKVLPILCEALSDDTPTRTVTVYDDSTKHVWKVNELVALLIRRVADRNFVIGEPGPGVSLYDIGRHPELQEAFQKLILTWYEENKDRTEEERKIADLQSNQRNRLDAIRWLGEHQSKQAAPLIAERIEKLLADGPASSSTHAELAEASLALGRIGNASTAPSVAKACQHFSVLIDKWSGSNDWINLFRAYEAMAQLGNTEQAISELRRIEREYGSKMGRFSREDYADLMKKLQG